MSEETPRDWRGTPITFGATIIYGAGVGRSIALVEGTVSGFTPKGSVLVDVVRRSFSSGVKPTVIVGADRLTVVEALAPSTLKTQADKVAEDDARMRPWYAERLAEAEARGERDSATYWRQALARIDKRSA